MFNKKTINIAVVIILGTLPTLAQASFIPEGCTSSPQGDCGLTEFLQTFSNFYTFLLKYLGALALLLFVIGGVMMITSGGNQERITRSRHILIGTTIGLLIVMGSFLFIKQFQEIIGVNENYQIVQDEDNFCNNQPDGTVCSGDDGNVYVCYLGVCQNGQNGRSIITSCEWNKKGTCVKNCNPNTNCVFNINGTPTPGNCLTNQCNGDNSVTCCAPPTS